MEINLLAIFATVAIAHFLALLSPGPDFVLIVKSSIKHGGKKSIGVAAGIASANAVYIYKPLPSRCRLYSCGLSDNYGCAKNRRRIIPNIPRLYGIKSPKEQLC